MEKNKKSKVKKIFIKIVLSAVAVVLIIVLPFINFAGDDDLTRIYNKFLGKKSELQGIIEIWNIDTFESGVASKSSFLEIMAREFENRNKGAYVLVRNLTEYECMTMLSSGQMPDLFSCSYGIAEKIKQYASPFDKNLKFGIFDNFLKAGQDEMGNQYGVAWCYGVYCLISTMSNLQKANVDLTNAKLSDYALKAGYVTKTKKGEKVTYSLGYGTKKYTLPKIAFKAYTKSELVSTSNSDIETGVGEKTPLIAYSDFLMGKSVMLFGTQRDIARMIGRQKSGKVSDVVFEHFDVASDLVQFFMLPTCSDSAKSKISQKYVEFITCDFCQSNICKIGMFSPSEANRNLYSEGIMSDITHAKIEDYRLFNIFDKQFGS